MNRRPNGFTLIEMLVVITIIGILATAAFPVASSVMRKTHNVRCQATVKDLQVAVNGYRTEYNRFPVRDSGGSDTTVTTDLGNSEFVSALMGEENNPSGLNSREVVFIELPVAKGNKGGLRGSEGSYELLDEWGMPYTVTMDTDENNKIDNPDAGNSDSTVSSGASAVLPMSVIVYSFGEDKMEQTKDDVTSWAGTRGASKR
jgi:prepilin-type N-terminal cleavage/methylation domain-containing protein